MRIVSGRNADCSCVPVIREVSAYEDLCAIAPQWSDLWDRTESATPFQSPEWLLPWWRRLFMGGEMWTLTAWDGARLTGLAPMFIHGGLGEPRQVSLIGSGVSDYLGFLSEDAEAARQLWSAIAAAPCWDLCDFQEIRGDSQMLEDPLAMLNVQPAVSSICPVLRLPSTMAELESSLSPKFRHHLRNSRNRLAQLGAVCEASSPAQDCGYVEALFRLHAARWEPRGEPGMLATPKVQCFFREALAGFRRRGWLRLHGLRFRGELKAVVCNFCTRGRTLYYLGGFDPELSRYSPGSVLIAHAIDGAIGERSVEFDFLRQREQYKYAWGAEDRINSRLLVHRRSRKVLP